MSYDYIRDPDAIYAASFAEIRAAADLSVFPEGDRKLAERVIHACGMPEIVDDLVIRGGPVAAGRAALQAGKPVLVDSNMTAFGVIRRLLPAENEVICTVEDSEAYAMAQQMRTTRSAAALELWLDRLDGAVVAIGNAPTALFHLLEMLEDDAPKPAVILGFPVGFVGAAESKEALIADCPADIPFATVRGRKGGSAMAAAAVNALMAKH
jgi:precorrin-8X/cobalt-precorrin-8 methylmutase